jgi:tetratricopeptide (TPR) repeat protein
MTDPVPAYVARGLMRVSDQSRPDLAVAEFAEAVRLTEERGNPSRTGGAYLLLAAAYGESGDDARAVEWLKRAVEFDDTRERAAQHLRDLGVK